MTSFRNATFGLELTFVKHVRVRTPIATSSWKLRSWRMWFQPEKKYNRFLENTLLLPQAAPPDSLLTWTLMETFLYVSLDKLRFIFLTVPAAISQRHEVQKPVQTWILLELIPGRVVKLCDDENSAWANWRLPPRWQELREGWWYHLRSPLKHSRRSCRNAEIVNLESSFALFELPEQRSERTRRRAYDIHSIFSPMPEHICSLMCFWRDLAICISLI